MNRYVVPLAVALALGFCGRAAALGIGDPAPKLEVKEFVKGDPVKEFEKGKIYVVEFWATWCGPCKASIPHVTELQKKHKEVVFIGVSVWERDQSKVAPFVKEKGKEMDYRVAIDDVGDSGKGDDGKMAKNWMTAAEQDGIPAAFIVNGEGKIAWIGHPMEMDRPLEQIVAGKYDLARATTEYTQFRAVKPELKKFEALAKGGDAEKTIEAATRLIEGPCKETCQGLNHVAWTIVEKPGEKPNQKLMELALKAAKRADELAEAKDASIADTLAKAYFETGDVAKALEHQERAVKLAVGTGLENDREMRERLDLYRKAAKK
jgi:thiol-disulfide isomerase/thioredoxin